MKVIKGDLLKTELYQIAHGCNAQGAMNSGIANGNRCYKLLNESGNHD